MPPIMRVTRLEHLLTQEWYKADKQMHDPVVQWLSVSPAADAAITKMCNKLLADRSVTAVHNAVANRSMQVQVTINLAKVASDFYAKLPPAARAGVEQKMVQTAIEMKFEESGYPIVNHVLEFVFDIPTPEQIEEAQIAARARQEARQAENNARKIEANKTKREKKLLEIPAPAIEEPEESDTHDEDDDADEAIDGGDDVDDVDDGNDGADADDDLEDDEEDDEEAEG